MSVKTCLRNVEKCINDICSFFQVDPNIPCLIGQHHSQRYYDFAINSRRFRVEVGRSGEQGL